MAAPRRCGARVGCGFAALAQAGARFIAPNADEIARVRARHSFLKATTCPPTAMRADGAIQSVGSWSYVLARPTLSDDIAYALARAIDKATQPW